MYNRRCAFGKHGIWKTEFEFFRRVALILRNSGYQERFERIGIASFYSQREQPDEVFQRIGNGMLHVLKYR